MNRTRLEGQVAWISGSASGIGQAIATLFAREGAKVAVIDVQAELGEAVVEQITKQGGQAIFFRCDVSQAGQVQNSIEQTVTHFGDLQIVVNSAGVVHIGALHEYSEQDWDTLMGVNLKSIFLAVKYGWPYLREQSRSYVVNIASVSGFVGQGGTPAYIASKSAVIGLTRAIALDYAAIGLRCNAVCPGITDTPMLRYHLNTTPDPKATLANRLRRVPMGVALPHPRQPMPYVSAEPMVCVARVPGGIGFGSGRGELTRLFFLVCCHKDRHHLRVLARLMRILQGDTVPLLIEAETPEELLQVLIDKEAQVVAEPQ